MLKRAAQFVFFIVISCLWHGNAHAQSAMADFSYPEKNEAIRLASMGDADALYKLGLSALYGVNSSQNSRVAERFFFYAAEKGHIEAKGYLIRRQAIDEASRPPISPNVTAKSKPNTQAKIAARKKAQAEKRRAKAAEKRVRVEEKRAQAKKRRANAQKKKALADKRKAIAKKRAAAQGKAVVTPTVAIQSAETSSSAPTSANSINPYVPNQPNQKFNSGGGSNGLFFIVFLILSLVIYLFSSYLMNSRRRPAGQSSPETSD